ncbi:Amino acid transporter, transmembrane domain containing protein [Trema orientale]|uniref:Amino acid transporter, transmembrane domain containing protein n=1 Tax=Trema orientale TaxID=63057 RepID=A0A2P5EA34_TREOI|nr:Amino acid transporter, transmembrane domain containing protein [Trema orientale]
MEDRGKTTSSTVPLLESAGSSTTCSGTSSAIETIANIVVSIVGTGILGLPFAFRVAGWLAGSLAVLVAAISTYYCMLLLVKCRDKLALDEEEKESTNNKTYGDLGYECMGTTGRFMVESLIFISYCGAAVANLVFIGQNLSSVLKGHYLTSSSYILLLLPIEIGLSWIRSLSSLAPFSIFANICNVLAMGIVVKEDIKQVLQGQISFRERMASTSNLGNLAFVGGVAVFCFEGFGMTLSLEASMRDKTTFPKVLGQSFSGLALLYVLFGFFGYMAYGDQTKDIITLNLPRNWWALAVQIGMCLGIIFTFPMMVHPINEIIEGRLKKSEWFHEANDNDCYPTTRIGKFGIYVSRTLLVIGLAMLATCVPAFDVFVSFSGCTVCALLSFVLPAVFHLKLLGSSLSFREGMLDLFILSCGLLFAGYENFTIRESAFADVLKCRQKYTKRVDNYHRQTMSVKLHGKDESEMSANSNRRQMMTLEDLVVKPSSTSRNVSTKDTH